MVTREEGIKEIEEAKWTKDEYGTRWLIVHDERGRGVGAWVTLRPNYCDRGHMQMCIDGHLNLDWADSFPRYFFSFEECDNHVRLFLKWRLWKHREHPHEFPEAQLVPFYDLQEAGSAGTT